MKDYFKPVEKHKPKQVFNVDAVSATRDNYKRQRAHVISLFAMLKVATSTAGELLVMTGPMTLNHGGKIGTLEAGAYADLLLVDGGPLQNVTVIGGNKLWLNAAKPTEMETVRLIMKDGEIHKTTRYEIGRWFGA